MASPTYLFQEAICAHLYEFAKKLPPSMHKTQKTKDKPKVYVKGPGLITGEHRICRGWHAIGHNVGCLDH